MDRNQGGNFARPSENGAKRPGPHAERRSLPTHGRVQAPSQEEGLRIDNGEPLSDHGALRVVEADVTIVETPS